MAKTTNKLKLYVYDTSQDGSMFFNIKQSMTDNFEKIDEFAIDTSNKLDNKVDSNKIATSEELGLVKVGSNLNIDSDGTLSATIDLDEDAVREIIQESLSNLTGKEPGELVWSLEPLQSSYLKLLDGSSIALNGDYKDFIDKYIYPLSALHPERFKSVDDWNTINDTYGTCSYYCLDGANNRLILPNLCGMIEITNDLTKGGEITEAGLPGFNAITEAAGAHEHTFTTNEAGAHTHTRGTMNITGTTAIGYGYGDINTGAFYATTTSCNEQMKAVDNISVQTGFDASRSWTGETSSNGKHSHTGSTSSLGSHTHTLNINNSEIYGKSTTVQPQTTKVYCYVVIANNVNKTKIDVDINNVLNDINNLSTELTKKVAVKADSSQNTTDLDNGYIVLDSNICIQWGVITGNQTTITFPYPFANTNYSFYINTVGSGFNFTETDKKASYITFTRNGTNNCYWLALGLAS